MRDLKRLTIPYPPPLKEALVRRHLWLADFALHTTRSPVERGDVLHATGSFFDCVASLVQVLHALNGRYLINEKGALKAVDSLPVRPDGFVETASVVLSRPGGNRNRLRESWERLNGLVEEVRGPCAGPGEEGQPPRDSCA